MIKSYNFVSSRCSCAQRKKVEANKLLFFCNVEILIIIIIIMIITTITITITDRKTKEEEEHLTTIILCPKFAKVTRIDTNIKQVN